MKKLALILGLVLLATPVFAETASVSDTLSKLPPLKQGVAWSLTDNKLNYLSTIEVVTFKGFNLEVGYAGLADNTGAKAVGVVSYKLLNLKEMGVKMPILDLIEFNIGGYGGYGRIQLSEGMGEGNNEWDAGISATIISAKW